MLVKYIHKKSSELKIVEENGKQRIVRKRVKGPIKGVIVAEKFNGEVHVGWSLCDKIDEFDLEHGKSLAMGRMFQQIPVAQSMRKHVDDMYYRARNYFKVG